jgi:hypothetical protein
LYTAAPSAPSAVAAPPNLPSDAILDSDDDDESPENEDEPPEAVVEEENDEDVELERIPWTRVEMSQRPTFSLRRGVIDTVPLQDLRPPPGRRAAATGPQRCSDKTTALEFFLLLFTVPIMNSFVTATNSYAAALKRVDWRDVTVPEFKVFVSMLLYFGVVDLPSRRMAWRSNSIFRMPWAATVMTCKRFEAILNNWHWMDSSHIAEAERKEKNKANPFWSVQGYVDATAQNFRDHYICPQCFDIDEQWKGRHLAKCYNPNKPSKWHFKVYSLNCSHTTYRCNFFMYQGRDENRPAGMPATVYPVYELLRDRFYWHLNYILYLDNWYTSVAVAVMLWVWGIYVVGTVRVNKKGIPKEAIFPKSGRGKRGRGEMVCMSKPLDDRGALYFTSWMDSKPVHMLHTTKSYTQTVQRAKKGTHQKDVIPQPSVIEDYNFGMRGTDGIDQLISYYRNEMRSKKWQPRLFIHFIHASVANAHILFKLTHKSERGDAGHSLLDFTELLIMQLCEEQSVRRDTPQASRLRSRDLDSCMSDTSRCSGDHFPIQYRREASSNSDPRRRCKMCNNKCGIFCTTCNVPLCIEAKDDLTPNCWTLFHTAEVSYRK